MADVCFKPESRSLTVRSRCPEVRFDTGRNWRGDIFISNTAMLTDVGREILTGRTPETLLAR